MALLPSGGIQGVIGKALNGTAVANAILVAIQQFRNFDVKSDDNVNFIFAFREEDSVELKSDITDHYTENNSAKEDQISLKPKEITLHGFIGELSDNGQGTNPLNGIRGAIQTLGSQLSVLSPYVPGLTVQALQKYNQAQQIFNSVASVARIVEVIYDLRHDTSRMTIQQKAYGFFEDKWKARSLFTVQTPWAIFKDMAIMSLKVNQDGESATISDFRITFKQMQFVSTTVSDFTVAEIAQGRAEVQSRPTSNSGTQSGTPVGALSPGGDNSSVLSA